MSYVIFPSRQMLEKAIIQAITNLGGEAEVRAINNEVIHILNLPEEIVKLEDESGIGTKLDYRLRWCRTDLKNRNAIRNVKKGTWALVDAE